MSGSKDGLDIDERVQSATDRGADGGSGGSAYGSFGDPTKGIDSRDVATLDKDIIHQGKSSTRL
jgi:hypothetical protein